MTAQLLPIEQNARDGQLLFDRIAAEHGSDLAAALRLSTRLFRLVSPLAPGLFFAGAEATLTPVGAHSGSIIASTGSGLSLQDAVAACIGETVERVSQGERHGDIKCRAPVSAVRAAVDPTVEELVLQIGAGNGHPSEQFIDWIDAVNLKTGEARLLPADWCLRRVPEGPLRMPATPLSIGVAAGPTFEAAAASAVLELIERDAVAHWWIGGRRGRPISLEQAAASGAPDLLAQVRQGCRDRVTWLLDLTTDMPIPTIAAVSVTPDGKGFACGTATRITIKDAARAALFELCQMELGLLVVQLKRQQRGDDALNDADRQHLARATQIDAAQCELLHPCGVPRADIADDGAIGLAHLRRVLAVAGVEVALAPLTRPDFGVPVCAAVAAELQRYPSAIVTARLQQTFAQTGGGYRWHRDVALG